MKKALRAISKKVGKKTFNMGMSLVIKLITVENIRAVLEWGIGKLEEFVKASEAKWDDSLPEKLRRAFNLK